MLSTNFSLQRINVGHSMPAQTQRATGYVTSPKYAPVSDSFTLAFAGKGDEASKKKNNKSHPSHIQGGRYMAGQGSRTPTAEEQNAYWNQLVAQDNAERHAKWQAERKAVLEAERKAALEAELASMSEENRTTYIAFMEQGNTRGAGRILQDHRRGL
jgi:hypothetical protein